MTRRTKLIILRIASSYATAAEAAAHFGGAYALLAVAGVSKDVALSTAALIAASAIYDQRLSSRLAVLEDRLQQSAKQDEEKEAAKMEEEAKKREGGQN